jgi:hypothetical protein
VSRHIQKKSVRFDVAFQPASRASVHGGQLAVHALLDQFGLWEKIRREPALDPRLQSSKGIDPDVYWAQFLSCFTSGGISLADAERLNEDVPLKAMLGIERFADQTSLGEYLREASPMGVAAARRIGREFVAWILQQADPRRLHHAGRLESFFDDTQIEVSGKCFEGAKMNYEGHLALSWQTFFVGPLLADQVLGATSDTKESPASDQAGKDVSACLPELLEANRHLWQGQPNYLYADSASSAGKYLEQIEDTFDAWSVSYNKWTGPLERKAAELPASAWSAEEQTTWSDGTEHAAQYAWCRHQPSGCERPKQFAVVRHKAAADLFWRHAFIACQAQTGDPKLVFEHHRLKGDKERALSELLTDLDLHHPPCSDLQANRLFYTLAAIAYNALQALKLIHLPEAEAPRRVRTLIRHLLLIPVQLKRHGRRLKACLFVPAGGLAWWRGFLAQLLPQCRQLSGVMAGGG